MISVYFSIGILLSEETGMFFRSNFEALELQIVQYIYNAVGKFLRHRKRLLPMPLFLGVAERRGLSLLVSLYALAIDNAAPVQTERKVVDISVGVAVATDVARTVFAMLLHSLHRFRQLHWQQC